MLTKEEAFQWLQGILIKKTEKSEEEQSQPNAKKRKISIIITVSSFVLAVAATAWLVCEFQYNKSATNIIVATVLLGVGAVGAILGSLYLTCNNCLSDARSQAGNTAEKVHL